MRLFELEYRVRQAKWNALMDRTFPREGQVVLPPAEPKPTHSELRFSELMDAYLEWAAPPNLAASTVKQAQHYGNLFTRFSKNCRVRDINRMMLGRFFSWSKKNHGRGPNAGNICMRNVKKVLLWADDMEICECPVAHFPKLHDEPPETKRLLEHEVKRLLEHLEKHCPEFGDMVAFGLLTGLRPRELRELQFSQILPNAENQKHLMIEHHKTAKTVGTPKPRSVPLCAKAEAIVRRQQERNPQSNTVFLNAKGKPFTKTVLRQRFERWCKRAGIRTLPPYSMRHTFGSLLAEANINQQTIATLMGHSQIRTTTRYQSTTERCHREAADALASRIFGDSHDRKNECQEKRPTGEPVSLRSLVDDRGLEPPTPAMSRRCSSQLS